MISAVCRKLPPVPAPLRTSIGLTAVVKAEGRIENDVAGNYLRTPPISEGKKRGGRIFACKVFEFCWKMS